MNMKRFIDPQKITLLCADYESYGVCAQKAVAKPEGDTKAVTDSSPSGWTKILDTERKAWKKIKPAVCELTSILTAAAVLVKAAVKFVTQYKRLKAVLV